MSLSSEHWGWSLASWNHFLPLVPVTSVIAAGVILAVEPSPALSDDMGPSSDALKGAVTLLDYTFHSSSGLFPAAPATPVSSAGSIILLMVKHYLAQSCVWDLLSLRAGSSLADLPAHSSQTKDPPKNHICVSPGLFSELQVPLYMSQSQLKHSSSSFNFPG